MKRLLLLITLAIAPTLAHAESFAYICRTQSQSCAFSYPSSVRDGTACHCNSQSGPVQGYSMPDPTAAPQTARVQASPPVPAQSPAPAPTQFMTSGSGECYRGIGNCPESYGR